MGRKERKYHYIYKITCIKNNRYYIGMHSTDNLEDGYFGGGKRIKNSVKKHGKDYHKKEILEFLESRDLLKIREREIVNEDLLVDTMCMNLALGGEGGGKIFNEKHMKSFSKAGNIKFQENLKDPEYKAAFGEKVRQNNIARRGKGMFSNEHNKGRIWITNGVDNKFIIKDEFEKYSIDGWSRGKTIKEGAKWNPWNKK